MRLLAHVIVPGFCPCPSVADFVGRKNQPKEYRKKIRETEEILNLQKYLDQKKDWRLIVRIDFYLSRKGRRLLPSDLDNLSKTALDGVFNENEERNSMKDRWVYSLEARKIEASEERDERTAIWVFAV